jgi:hypothetical protein
LGALFNKRLIGLTAFVEIKFSPTSVELMRLYSLIVAAYVLNVVKSWNGKKDLLLIE